MDQPSAGSLKRATLEDVAALAGVSIGTASKAINQRAEVRESTRRKVLDAAAQLGFRPNLLAQGLAGGRSSTVGLLTSRLEGRFVLPMLRGAEDAFGTDSVSVLLSDTRGDSIRERHHLETLLSRRVDGIIVMGSTNAPRSSLGSDLPVPVVYAYSPSEDESDISLLPDNFRAGYDSAKHILATGRTAIAAISGRGDYVESRSRVAGVIAALAERGLVLSNHDAEYGAWSEHWGSSAAHGVMNAVPETQAIICGNDQIARGVISALSVRGLSVPGDVAVIGFDNWTDIIAGSKPALSSVDMRLEVLGATAARYLADVVAGVRHGGVHLLECQIVARESTAAVPLHR